MKILVSGLSINQKKAGTGQYGFNLINALEKDRIGHDISVVLQKGIHVKNKSIIERGPYKKSMLRILDEQFLLPLIYRKYDLIHHIDYSSAVFSKKDFVLTVHDLSYYEYPETFTKFSGAFKRSLASIGIYKAKKVIVSSENTKRDMIKYFPKAEEKIEVIYPGRPGYKRIEDKKTIDKTIRKYGLGGQYILGVGTLEPRKNIERLIEAFREVAKHNKEIKLALVGKKGWLYEPIFEKIAYWNLQDRIIWTGYVPDEDMPVIYSGAKIFVYPSIYEGFGLPPLEAMSCGVPVITSNVSSLPEVVGDAAVLINPMEVGQIKDAILTLLHDEELTEKLIAKGINQSKKFDWHVSAQKVVDIYNELIN